MVGMKKILILTFLFLSGCQQKLDNADSYSFQMTAIDGEYYEMSLVHGYYDNLMNCESLIEWHKASPDFVAWRSYRCVREKSPIHIRFK